MLISFKANPRRICFAEKISDTYSDAAAKLIEYLQNSYECKIEKIKNEQCSFSDEYMYFLKNYSTSQKGKNYHCIIPEKFQRQYGRKHL